MRSAFADMIANVMLESDMPDFKKASIRLLMKAKKVSNQINDIVDTYADPVKDEEKDKAMYPVREEAYKLLERFESEITEFVNSHPLPVDTQD